jgi:putative FmdB family regulatory protein
MPVYDYSCLACGQTSEARRGLDVESIPCPACGGKAKRETVYRLALGTKEKKYRVSEFLEASQEIDHTYSQVERREGRTVKRPNFYKNAVKKVRDANL